MRVLPEHQRCLFRKLNSAQRCLSIIYLDGVHTFEQTLRDFTNAIHFLDPIGVIVIDDIVPTSYQASLPDQALAVKVKEFVQSSDNSWMGDTFKIAFFLESFFTTYQMRTTADNHGQAVLWRRPKASNAFRAFSALEIAHLQFSDVIKHPEIFHKMRFADIIDEISQERGLGRLGSRKVDINATPIGGLKRQPLNSLAVERVRLASGVDYSLPGSTVYTNMAEFDPAFALHYNRDIYSDQLRAVEPIDLVQLATATLHPGEYIVSVGGDIVEEQIPPSIAAGGLDFISAPPRIEEVSKETVIVARYGSGTWGHWLGELLPKIVMVEAAFPGRFSFAIPQAYDAPGGRIFENRSRLMVCRLKD